MSSARGAGAVRTVRDGITKDTVVCLSLAARPSNRGTRFHNHLYDALGLDYVYKAFAPADLAGAVAGIRGLGVRGAAVSMPYKEAVLDLVDVVADSAAVISSVNTIVNDRDVPGGHLTAHNTDYLAVASLLASDDVSRDLRPVVAGSGGMAKAVVAALRDGGWADGLVLARNEATGRALADAYGWAWSEGPGVASDRDVLLVNATPLGMAGGSGVTSQAMAFDVGLLPRAPVVMDVVATPVLTPLVAAARASGARVITGDAVATLQAVEQFVLYTGVRPEAALVEEAAAFAAAGA